ncbi:MAG: hypothetical protein WCH83_00530 [Alphaproteobacteria bacterium]
MIPSKAYAVMTLCSALMLGACARPTITPEARYLLTKPIDCGQASTEIAILESMKPDTPNQAMTVVSTLSPQGILSMATAQDFESRRQVVSGEYGAEIDRRIATMKRNCVTAPSAPPPVVSAPRR